MDRGIVYIYHYDTDPSHTNYGEVLRLAPDELEAFLESEESASYDSWILECVERFIQINQEIMEDDSDRDALLKGIVVENSPYIKEIEPQQSAYSDEEQSAYSDEELRDLERKTEDVLRGNLQIDDLSLDEVIAVGSMMSRMIENLIDELSEED